MNLRLVRLTIPELRAPLGHSDCSRTTQAWSSDEFCPCLCVRYREMNRFGRTTAMGCELAEAGMSPSGVRNGNKRTFVPGDWKRQPSTHSGRWDRALR